MSQSHTLSTREPAAAGPVTTIRDEDLSARIEPFDSYWQAPDDVEAGFRSFAQYYRYNVLPHVPADKSAPILVVSCGPGYLLSLLAERGYTDVTGIDSDPEKIAIGERRGLDCRVARCFEFIRDKRERYEAIICEQELSHLTHGEMIAWLESCRAALRPGGVMFVYGLNGANPLVGSENLAHNIDHFNTFTEYSLGQVLELGGFDQIRILPLKLYVFWKNPLNYVGLFVTGSLELAMRVVFKIYGKKVSILSKKIAATCRKPR